MQSGTRIQHMGNHIHRQRYGRSSARDLGASRQMHMRFAVNFYRIAGFNAFALRLDLLRMDERDQRLIVAVSDRLVQTARHFARSDVDKGCLTRDAGDDRRARFDDAGDFPADGARDHVNRLLKADMADDGAFLQPHGKLLRRKADSLAA